LGFLFVILVKNSQKKSRFSQGVYFKFYREIVGDIIGEMNLPEIFPKIADLKKDLFAHKAARSNQNLKP